MSFDFSYRHKNWMLLGGIVVLSFLSYHLAIQRTIESHSSIRLLENQLQNTGELAGQLNEAQAELSRLEGEIGLNSASRDVVQRLFLDRISGISDSLSVHLIDYQPTHLVSQADFTIATHQVTLSGAFIPIIRAIASLESNTSVARIVGYSFERKRNLKLKVDELYATIYAQTILP